MAQDGKPVDRRKVLLYALGGATEGAAGLVGGVEWYRRRSVPGAPRVQDRPGIIDPAGCVTARRRLGRTNLQVSVIGIGAGGLEGPEPIARAVDRGMNFIDTSVCYGNSEEVIAQALRLQPGLRDKLVIATKWDAGHDATKEKILESLDKSLRRLGVDMIDIMQLHWLGGGGTRDLTMGSIASTIRSCISRWKRQKSRAKSAFLVRHRMTAIAARFFSTRSTKARLT